jgi:rubrerythrin
MRGEKMTEASRQPKDKNYNLISALYQASENVETFKTYLQDAENEGDEELVEFFNAIIENNQRAAQRAKEMLVPRLQGSRSSIEPFAYGVAKRVVVRRGTNQYSGLYSPRCREEGPSRKRPGISASRKPSAADIRKPTALSYEGL